MTYVITHTVSNVVRSLSQPNKTVTNDGFPIVFIGIALMHFWLDEEKEREREGDR